MPNPQKGKKEAKIPVRIVAKSEVTVEDAKDEKFKPTKTEPDKKKGKTANRKLAAKKRQPKSLGTSKQKKQLFVWVTVMVVLIFTGWLFYFKGVISRSGPDITPLQEAGQKLTNVFQGVGQVFSNIQNVDNIESSSEQNLEEVEKRVFPQFVEKD